MRNYDSRLKTIEEKLIPKMSLFQIYATTSKGERKLIQKQVIPNNKGKGDIRLNIGRGICSDEEIEEHLKNNQRNQT